MVPDRKIEYKNSKFKVNLNQKIFENRQNALFKCCAAGATNQVVSLIKGGAGINSFSDGYSALAVAVLNGHFDLSKKLLKLGADPSQPQPAGGTPIGLIIVRV